MNVSPGTGTLREGKAWHCYVMRLTEQATLHTCPRAHRTSLPVTSLQPFILPLHMQQEPDWAPLSLY